MKLQASELPLGKPQTRRKAPKIAPLLIAFTVLFTIIPLYYPSFRYNRNPKKISDTSTSSSFDSVVAESIASTISSNNPDPDPVDSVLEHNKYEDNQPKEDDQEEEVTNITKKVAETDRQKDDVESEVNKPQKTDPTRLPSSTKSELAIQESLERNSDQLTATSMDTNGLGLQEQQPVGSRKRSSSGRRERKRPNRRQRDPSKERRGKAAAAAASRRFPPLSDDHSRNNIVNGVDKEEGYCDLFSGEWVPNPEGPYYTNTTCWAIQEHQNCMKFGRPDWGFLKWRWKPDGCELPIFDPNQFLELLRGKSIAFVGDSVARNHMQSLICLLSRVVYPVDTSNTLDQNKRWVYQDYNFNISMFWAPYLVRSLKTDPDDVTKPFSLYLDEFDEDWTNNVGSYDYIIISAGHWFFRPTMFYVDRRLVGCQYCPQENVTHLNSYFSYRRAFRTAFRAINSLENFKGVAYIRTFAPSHFEGGPWDKGGDCSRTKPFRMGERVLDDYNLEMYTIQLQEFRIAQKEGRRKGRRFKLFDVTQSMLLRPDGHPSKYGHWQNQNVSMANDCVHWCLPGPIDSWNDFLLELLKREQEAADRYS